MSSIFYFIFCFFAMFVHYSPEFVKKTIGIFIGTLWFDILRIRRQLAINNVKLAFPEKSEKECVRIARASLHHMGFSAVEFFSFPFLNQKRVNKIFEWDGKEKLEEAIKKGDGVCGLSLHMGNGDFGGVGLVAGGFDTHIIVKDFSNKIFHDLVTRMRMGLGVRLIKAKKSSQSIMNALQGGSLVIFVSDQFMAPPRGVRTIFFGKPTGTAIGLSVFAKKSGSQVLPIYTYRKSISRHVLKIGDPIPLESDSDHQAQLEKTTQIYATYIEKIVRAHPEQWLWVHRRWKPGFD